MTLLGPWWKRVVRAASAALIAYLFVAVLVTASLQAGIAERLGALDEPIDYSTGYALWRESAAIGQATVEQRGRATELSAQKQNWQHDRDEANERLQILLAQLQMVLRRVAIASRCDAVIMAAATGAVEEARSAAALVTILRQCAAGPSVPADAREEAQQFIAGGVEPLMAAANDLLTANRNVRLAEAQLEAIPPAIAALEARWRSTQPVRTSFSDLGVLRHAWLRPAGILAELPPTVVQIVLAFVSGLFGSLLVTLVLIVYPRTELDLTSDKARFGARILLGGLISLCVFVVLGGGTAVLGSGNGFAAGDANYLAFCAIGILAGMFSDRVADWLSDRANAFFRSSSRQEERASNGASVEPPS